MSVITARGSNFSVASMISAAAMVCASLRGQHPQIASAVALAAGVAALTLSIVDIRALADAVAMLCQSLPETIGDRYFLLRICGIAVIAEFASDICRDSGESALARRIETGTKIAVLAASLPMATELMDALSQLLI